MTPLLLALCAWLSPAAAQTAPAAVPPPPCTLITDARALTPSGWQDGVSVLIRAGRIAAVGPGLTAEPECARVDGAGQILTPGLIDPWSTVGLVEVSQEGASRDSSGAGPALRSLDAYNPRSTAIPLARAAGVTSAVVGVEGPELGGTAAWVDLAGERQTEAVQDTAVSLYWAPGSNMAQALYTLRGTLDEARAFARDRAAWEQNRSRPFQSRPDDLEALQPLLRGELPLVVAVNSAADIEALLRFAREQKLRVVVLGGAEAHLVAAELAQAQVPVIVEAYVYGPGGFDQIHARPDNAALLHAAGVQVMFTSRSAHNLRMLPQLAGNAVREGLPYDAAVQALCLTPAQVFGLPGHGRLAPGAVANLVLWSGDPLELSTTVNAVWVHGERSSLQTRQSALTERYRTLPGRPAPLPDSALPLSSPP